jgi:hypothetical protein
MKPIGFHDEKGGLPFLIWVQVPSKRHPETRTWVQVVSLDNTRMHESLVGQAVTGQR